MPTRYVQLPNGKYLEWPEGVSAADFKAKAAKLSGEQPAALTPAAEPPKEGFLESLGHTFGIGKEEDAQRLADFKAHPIRSLAMDALGPAGQMASGLIGGVKRIGGEIGEAEQMRREGNPAGVAEHAAYALPFVGAGIKRGVEQLGPNELINPAEAGTALGTAAQAAPLLADAAGGVGSSIRSAAIGDTDAAALRGLRVPAGSPKIQSTLRSVEGARPYLQGANSLEDLQSRIPAAKNEIWGKYKGTVDHLADKPVQGPDGQTTVGDLEAERQQLSALNRGIKKGSPEALQLAQQKGMSAAELLDREKAVQGALDPHLEEAGIDPKLIRQTFGQVADIGSKVSGKSTIIEPTRPYGFAKLGDLSLTKPLSNFPTIGSAARDIAAGRYWSDSPTDVGIREGFRAGGPKPDFRAPSTAMPRFEYPPAQLPASTIGNADIGAAGHEGLLPSEGQAGTATGPRGTVAPPPRSLIGLPAQAGAGEAQPMIRYARPYVEPPEPNTIRSMPPERWPLLPAQAGPGETQPYIAHQTIPAGASGETTRIAPPRFAPKGEILPPSGRIAYPPLPEGAEGPTIGLRPQPRGLLSGAQETVPAPPANNLHIYPAGSEFRNLGVDSPQYPAGSQFRAPIKPFDIDEYLKSQTKPLQGAQ